MSYWMRPLKKGAKNLDLGAFSWPHILNETGACYLLYYGQNSISPGSYYYSKGNHGSPISNDGYKVTASEAKMIGKLLKGYVFIKRCIREQWEEMDEAARQNTLKYFKDAEPPSAEYIEKVDKVADFCLQSGGFRIR
jgi:hypothetical protein